MAVHPQPTLQDLHQDFISVPDNWPDAAGAAPKLLGPMDMYDAFALPTPAPCHPPRQVPDVVADLGDLTLAEYDFCQLDPVLQHLQGDSPPQDTALDPFTPWSLQHLPLAPHDTQAGQCVPQGPPHQSPGAASPPRPPQEVRLPAANGAPASPAAVTAGGRARRNTQRARQERKPKLYQRQERFEDPAQEKRRIDAINSKKNRDRKAADLADLRDKVRASTQQRDLLQQEVLALRQREAELLRQLAARPAPLLTPSSYHLRGTPPPPYHAHHISLTPPPAPDQGPAASSLAP